MKISDNLYVDDLGCWQHSFKTFMFFHIFHSENPYPLRMQMITKEEKERKCKSGIAVIILFRPDQWDRGLDQHGGPPGWLEESDPQV